MSLLYDNLDTFDAMKNLGMYYIIIIEDKKLNQIVATGSLILERKFIHSCGQVRILLNNKNTYLNSI